MYYLLNTTYSKGVGYGLSLAQGLRSRGLESLDASTEDDVGSGFPRRLAHKHNAPKSGRLGLGQSAPSPGAPWRGDLRPAGGRRAANALGRINAISWLYLLRRAAAAAAAAASATGRACRHAAVPPARDRAPQPVNSGDSLEHTQNRPSQFMNGNLNFFLSSKLMI